MPLFPLLLICCKPAKKKKKEKREDRTPTKIVIFKNKVFDTTNTLTLRIEHILDAPITEEKMLQTVSLLLLATDGCIHLHCTTNVPLHFEIHDVCGVELKNKYIHK